MENFKSFIIEKKYKSQMSKKDKYKASKDYLMLKTQQSKLGKMPDKYKERKGLEGPFMTKSGQVVYYDKKFGQYYNSDTDMYIDYDDWKKMSEAEEIDEISPAARRKRNQAHLLKTMAKYRAADKAGIPADQVNQRRNSPTRKKSR